MNDIVSNKMSFATISKIASLLHDEKPHMIVTPDPWYAHDFHPDHIHTGMLTTPPPVPLEELERELESRDKETST